MATKRAKYYSFSLNDRAGEIASITTNLRESNVDLAGLWAFATGQGNAETILVPKNPAQFGQVAQKAGWKCKEGTCFHVSGDDKPGALTETLAKAAKEGINLRAVDAVAINGQFGGYVWCEEKDVEKLAKLLGA